jgi:hypothetical protein
MKLIKLDRNYYHNDIIKQIEMKNGIKYLLHEVYLSTFCVITDDTIPFISNAAIA